MLFRFAALFLLTTLLPFSLKAQDLLRDKICLSGSWQFQALSNEIKIGSPHEMRVPGSWGASGENLFSLAAEEFAVTEAAYKRNFFAPLEWKGKGRIKLTLDAVVDGHRILVNGKKLLDSDVLGLLEEIDLTEALKFGSENSLEILTRAFTSSNAKLSRIDRGILGDVWLSHVPETRVLWSHAFSDVKNKTLTVKTLLTNEGGDSQNASLTTSTWDEGKKALDLGEKSIPLPAKGSALVEQRAAWPKVVPWGFGRYGSPKLYTLRAEIISGPDAGASSERSERPAGKKMDSFDDRFGFRDFRIEGTNYLFNGMPYYIAGDLSSRRGVFTENPSYIQAFLTRERASGMTFHRLHTHLGSTFDHPAWYEVADEMGHLIEAQNCRVTSGGKLHEADSDLNQAVWAATVNKHFNHPSIVMWCVDNESFSVAFKDIPDIPVDKIKAFDRLMTFVRALDPSRIVEIQHNWTLWPFVKRGIMKAENFPTFNIHPYGKLDTEVRESMRVAGYEPTVPTCIGEVYTFPKDLDFLSRPGVAYGEQDRKLRSYKQQLEDVSAVDGVQGLILCAMMADGFVGFTDPEHWHLGPWDDYAVRRGEGGEPTLRREFKVKVPWPSLSGPGVKAETILGYHVYYAVGFGLNVNWFDPTRPLYRSNVIDSGIKSVMEKIAGVAAPANTERASELVVCVTRGGTAVEGAYVRLIPLESQAQPYSVAADASGTAWFRVWGNGKYRSLANVDGKILQADVVLKRPSSASPPGYAHMNWLELGGGSDLATLKKNLQNPASFTDSFDILKNEVSANGGFTAWSAPNKLIKWNGTASLDECNGKPAIKITASDRQVTQPIQLVRGRNYTLQSEMRGGRGTAGNIKITDSRYAIITSLPGVLGETKWRHFETNFTAAESGLAYLFCQIVGSGAGDAGFAQVHVIGESNPDPLPAAFYPGPYAVTSKGFIRHWLALGPFPNRLDENGYEGFRTDWLKEVGGESGVSAAFAGPVSVEFPNGFYWKAGKAKLHWRPLDSPYDRVFLNSMGLPNFRISDQDPVSVCAYVAATIVSPDERDGRIALGSDDGYKAFLNGDMVGRVSTNRGSKPDQETYPIHLKAGENRLLLKVFQDSGGWNFYARFTTPDGRPMTDLREKIEGSSDGEYCLTPEGGSLPALSPDGSRLVFELRTNQNEAVVAIKSPGESDTTNLVAGICPQISPDGLSVYTLRGGTGKLSLWKVPVDKPERAVPLSDVPEVERLFGWAGNDLIASHPTRGLVVISGLAGQSRQVSDWKNVANAREVSVSPDGQNAAVVVNDENGIPSVRLIELKSGREIAKTQSVAPSSTGRVGGCHSPSFSPDGKRVVFVREGIQPDADIQVIDLASGRILPITSDRARNRAPRFAPDGKGVIYAAVKGGTQEKIYYRGVPEKP